MLFASASQDYFFREIHDASFTHLSRSFVTSPLIEKQILAKSLGRDGHESHYRPMKCHHDPVHHLSIVQSILSQDGGSYSLVSSNLGGLGLTTVPLSSI